MPVYTDDEQQLVDQVNQENSGLKGLLDEVHQGMQKFPDNLGKAKRKLMQKYQVSRLQKADAADQARFQFINNLFDCESERPGAITDIKAECDEVAQQGASHGKARSQCYTSQPPPPPPPQGHHQRSAERSMPKDSELKGLINDCAGRINRITETNFESFHRQFSVMHDRVINSVGSLPTPDARASAYNELVPQYQQLRDAIDAGVRQQRQTGGELRDCLNTQGLQDCIRGIEHTAGLSFAQSTTRGFTGIYNRSKNVGSAPAPKPPASNTDAKPDAGSPRCGGG